MHFFSFALLLLSLCGVKVNYYECKLADLSPVRRNHFTL